MTLNHFKHFKPLDGQILTKEMYDWANHLVEKEDFALPEAIENYEKALQNFQETPFALAFGSGRSALFGLLSALQLPKGTKVLLPAFTCVAVPQAVIKADCETVFYDIEAETYGPDIQSLTKAFAQNPDAKVVIIHHLFGLVSRDYEALVSFAKSKNCIVIEDIAQSLGARYKGNRVGNLGDAAFSSGEQSKLLCTMQGGMAFLNDKNWFENTRNIRNNLALPSKQTQKAQLKAFAGYYKTQAAPSFWWQHKLYTYLHHKHLQKEKEQNWPIDADSIGNEQYIQLSEPMAYLAKEQLSKLDQLAERRRKNYPALRNQFTHLPCIWPTIIQNSEPVFLRVPLQTTEKAKHLAIFKSLGFQCGTWFDTPIHPSSFLPENCPVANDLAGKMINIGVNRV